MNDRTIAAIATPVFLSSIGVIRISGQLSFNIIKDIFKPFDSSKDCLKAKGYTSMYGQIFDGSEVLDDVVIHFFRKPLSYTGEDVIEISCHGGVFVVKKILGLVLSKGAFLAEPGEFTKLAVLNGKMNLSQAEAVIDVINARDKNSLRLANYQKNGKLVCKINGAKDKILEIIYHIAAFIDYPEEDIEDIDFNMILKKLEEVKVFLEKLSSTYNIGSIIKSGVDTSIVGKPNVGKSSLMNALSKDNLSIVSNIEGTTRDIVRNSVQLENVILNLNDTAGIRETNDEIEELGKNLSIEKIKSSSLILLVFDFSNELDNNDYKLCEEVDKDITIAVLNKTDLNKKIDEKYIKEKFKYIVKISAKNEENIALLENKIEEVIGFNNIDMSMGIISNERHKQLIDKTIFCVDNVISVIKNKSNLDMITFDLEEAVKHLLEFNGENITENVVDGIFSRFCVGK